MSFAVFATIAALSMQQATTPPQQSAPAATTPAPAAAPATDNPVAATPADIVAGATVNDSEGQLIGVIDKTVGANAIVKMGTRSLSIPMSSFGKNSKGLLLPITRAKLEASLPPEQPATTTTTPDNGAATTGDDATGGDDSSGQ